MENKKMKLCSNNLDVISFMQHITYINISTRYNLRKKDFNDESVKNNFELICDNYIRLYMTPFISSYRGELSSNINKYIIKSNLMIEYTLIIDLEKDYHNCVKIGINFKGKKSNPVTINVFNIKFESGG